MMPIVDDKPYRFIPPYPGTLWARLAAPFLPLYLRRSWGIDTVEVRHLDRLKASLEAGHGVLLAPNHARPCDPAVVGLLPLRLGWPCHFVAASHVFTAGGRFRAWAARRAGAFSIHRWGMDRESLKASIQILSDARRPLLLFPEGIITRTNDRLNALLEGTAFITRSAAKIRAGQTPAGQVVVHPVGVRYLFRGDLAAAVGPVLEMIEGRLTWRPRPDRPLVERVLTVGRALLALKEIEYLGEIQSGGLRDRLRALAAAVLAPLETVYFKAPGRGSVVERVKKLRTAILPDLVEKNLPPAERDRRWEHLGDCYVAQQLDCYPGDYLAPPTTVDRVLETVERFEEDLTDRVRVHRPLTALVEVGEAVPVEPGKGRGTDEALMTTVEERLRAMLGELARECRPYPADGGST